MNFLQPAKPTRTFNESTTRTPLYPTTTHTLRKGQPNDIISFHIHYPTQFNPAVSSSFQKQTKDSIISPQLIFNSETKSNTQQASHRPSEAGASIHQSPNCRQIAVPANICGKGSSPSHSTTPPKSSDSRPSVIKVDTTTDPVTHNKMGLSRKSSSTNTPPLAKAQPSNSHLNNLGKTSTPTTNGTVAPAIAGHDKIHSTNTSTPSSLAGSIGSGADSKELKFFDHMTGSNNNGPKSPDNAAVAAAAAVAAKEKSDKNPMSSRLSRMFTPSGREKEKLREKEKEVERRKQHPEPSHSATTSPMPRHSEKDGGNSSDTDGGQSRGSSVAGDHPPKSRNVSGQHKNGEVHMIRFDMLEDGVNHVHHLRAAKRQEKLSTFGTILAWWWTKEKRWMKSLRHRKTNLSLMHSWVDQWKTEKVAVVKKDGSQPPSATLVEKYGRCQEIIGRGMSPCF